ncbi:MAG: excinuclease ABC subunit UvrC [Candidatus Bruticola sp.]
MSRNKRRTNTTNDAAAAVEAIKIKKSTRPSLIDSSPHKLPRPKNVITEEERLDTGRESVHPFLQEKLETLPASPGVYLMRDERRRVIYVGKSACLKNRVRSYFKSKHLPEKNRWMVSLIRDFDIITVNTEMEALILENELIKKHRPYFNILFRDDKSYPYLELTTFEKYPRLRIIRSRTKLRGLCFGPYAGDSLAVKRTKDTVQKLFKLRPCREKLDTPRSRPCLYYQLNLCTAPCSGGVSPQEYAAQIDKAVKFLQGHTGQLSAQLRQEIAAEASKLNYEECAKLRDTLQSLEILIHKQQILLNNDSDEDYICLVYDQSHSVLAAGVRQVREGKLQGQHNFILESRLDSNSPAELGAFIQRYYSDNGCPPSTIVIEIEPQDSGLLQDWLSQYAGHKVKFVLPKRGARKQILGSTEENTSHFLSEELHAPSRSNIRLEALNELQQALNLPEAPWRMECYDISNIQGKYSVGSMVVFEHGLPHRSHYRKFKIKELDSPNDFAMMSQVLERRLSYLTTEKTVFSTEEKTYKQDISLETMPNLIIVDGGLGQLHTAWEILKKLKLTEQISVVGLAKREEEIFLPNKKNSLFLPLNSKAYNLVTHLRNEAHRFAITFHRQLRNKGMFSSVLTGIPRLGPKYLKLLRTHFTNLAALKAATAEELQRLPGIGKKMAQLIIEALHKESENTDQ